MQMKNELNYFKEKSEELEKQINHKEELNN